MPSLLPFDNALIGDHHLPAELVLPGSGTYQERGRDIATTTADGRIHHDRQAVDIRARLELRGDHTHLDTLPATTDTITLRRGSTVIATFTGLVSASWSDRTRTTILDFAGDPIVS